MAKSAWERLTIKQRQELSEIFEDLYEECKGLLHGSLCDEYILRHGKEACPIYRLFTFFGWTPYCEENGA